MFAIIYLYRFWCLQFNGYIVDVHVYMTKTCLICSDSWLNGSGRQQGYVRRKKKTWGKRVGVRLEPVSEKEGRDGKRYGKERRARQSPPCRQSEKFSLAVNPPRHNPSHRCQCIRCDSFEERHGRPRLLFFVALFFFFEHAVRAFLKKPYVHPNTTGVHPDCAVYVVYNHRYYKPVTAI